MTLFNEQNGVPIEPSIPQSEFWEQVMVGVVHCPFEQVFVHISRV